MDLLKKKVIDEPDCLNIKNIVPILHVYSSLNHFYECQAQEYVLSYFLLPNNILTEMITKHHKLSELLQVNTSMARNKTVILIHEVQQFYLILFLLSFILLVSLFFMMYVLI